MTDDAPRKRPPGPGRGNRVPMGSGIPAGGQIHGTGSGGPARPLPPPNSRTREAIANKAARAERLIERLEHLADNAQRESDQIAAAVGALKHLVTDANTETMAAAVASVSAKPMTAEEWQAQHGEAGDLGAATGTATRAH